jgi:hypothetical protein
VCLGQTNSISGTTFKEGPGVNWFPNGDALGKKTTASVCFGGCYFLCSMNNVNRLVIQVSAVILKTFFSAICDTVDSRQTARLTIEVLVQLQ